ncbi:MAG: hypothetical protein WBI17_08535 [Clostridiaceae bacterium]
MSQVNYSTFLGKKLSVLTQVYENTQVNEGNVEECIKAVEINESHFLELLEIESKLENTLAEVSPETSGMLEEIYSLLMKVSENTSRLNKVIENERDMAMKAIEQFSKKREVTNSYMKLDQRSVFVDKDFK